MKKLIVVALFASSAAYAADVNTERNVGLSLAQALASATVEACTAKGYAVSATVVDRTGLQKVTLRADNAGPHTLDSAYRKAYTSASTKTPSGVLQENAMKNPAAANVKDIDKLLFLAGGLPIKIGNETIGAIGVGGAPGGNLDEQCAATALEQLKDRLK